MLDPGPAHTAPTYASRDPGSYVSTAMAVSPLAPASGGAVSPLPFAHMRLYCRVMDIALSEQKSALRKQAQATRELAHASVGDHAPLVLASRMFPLEATVHRRTISGFHPYQSEIDVRPLLGMLAGQGWTTALPVIMAKGQPLEFRRWLPGEPTSPGHWGILRPSDDAPVVEPDVLLVPMLAFDRKGFRLGYGGGYYDRTLEKLRALKKATAIGVAYAAQEVDAVPRGPHDQPLDFIMTEKELFACG